MLQKIVVAIVAAASAAVAATDVVVVDAGATPLDALPLPMLIDATANATALDVAYAYAVRAAANVVAASDASDDGAALDDVVVEAG